jgi:hypothetical protein
MKTKYQKENLIEIINKSKNLTEVLRYLNMTVLGNSRNTIRKYIKLHDIDISHFETTKERYDRISQKNGKLRLIPVENQLFSGSTISSNKLKIKLYKANLKQPICEECGQDENWLGKKMSLILDHINGIHDDNRIENLRIVCPNCNATLSTHCRGYKIIKKDNEEYQNNHNKYKSKYYTDKQIDSRINRRKINRPPYEQLLNEIIELGYSGTGRKYGVSDNAIRKWKKYYENNK